MGRGKPEGQDGAESRPWDGEEGGASLEAELGRVQAQKWRGGGNWRRPARRSDAGRLQAREAQGQGEQPEQQQQPEQQP